METLTCFETLHRDPLSNPPEHAAASGAMRERTLSRARTRAERSRALAASLVADGVDVHGELDEAVGVAPLVVVPARCG